MVYRRTAILNRSVMPITATTFPGPVRVYQCHTPSLSLTVSQSVAESSVIRLGAGQMAQP